MDKKAFFDRFAGLLKNTKERLDLDSPHDALIVWFAENWLLLDAEDAKDRIIEDKHAEGVDAILVDRLNYELLLIQAKTVASFGNTSSNFSETDVKSTLGGVRFLLQGDYKQKITPELENLVDEYHELDKTGDYKTRIVFVTLKQPPVDDKFIRAFSKDFPQIHVDFYHFDLLHDFYENRYLVLRAAPPENISFKVMTNLLSKEEPHASRIFICKGEELAKIYNDYRERIFQQNVRFSLGLKSRSINRQILETAVDETKSREFWYYNNGITIVCNEIASSSSGRVINLKNAQIINGAQTTYALYEAYQRGELRDDVELLVKAIQSEEREFIENVTLYTNSQNAIRLRDLCSNDEVQRKTQKVLLGSYGYFYERKRGEFDSLYPTAEAKKNLLGADYRNRLISNENAGQALLAFYLSKPMEAKAEKARIFMKEVAGFYDRIFDREDDLLPEELLLSWKLLRFVEMLKKQYRRQYRKAELMAEGKRREVYEYDFLLHSEYFILDIMRDFLLNEGLDIDGNKDDMLKVISEDYEEKIRGFYETIIDLFAEYITEIRKEPWYYHNKFFKSDKSIGLIRSALNRQHDFIEIIL